MSHWTTNKLVRATGDNVLVHTAVRSTAPTGRGASLSEPRGQGALAYVRELLTEFLLNQSFCKVLGAPKELLTPKGRDSTSRSLPDVIKGFSPRVLLSRSV